MKKGFFISAGLLSVLTIGALFSQLLVPIADAQSNGTWALDALNNVVTAVGAGNVGIGTANPDRPLTIQGSGGLVSFRDSTGATKWHISNAGGDWALAQTGVASRIQVGAQTGSVGLSMTPNPLVKLDVAGAIRVGTGINEAVVSLPGTIYFNGTNLRCYDGGQWKNCVGSGGPGGGVGFIAPATTNLLTKWDASGATLANSNISDSGSQVSVLKPLQVTGNLSVSGALSATTGAAANCSAGQVLSGQRVQGGIVTGGTCATFVSSTPGFSYFTPDPAAPAAGRLLTTGGITHLGVGATNNFRNTVALTIRAQAGTAGWIQLQDDQGNNKWHFSEFGSGFSFSETGVGTRFFIQDGTGNLGVGTGTSAPGAKLEVSSPTKNTLRIRHATPGSVDLFSAVGSGTGDSMCGAPTTGACVAAFDASRSSIACSASGAIRALCAAVGD